MTQSIVGYIELKFLQMKAYTFLGQMREAKQFFLKTYTCNFDYYRNFFTISASLSSAELCKMHRWVKFSRCWTVRFYKEKVLRLTFLLTWNRLSLLSSSCPLILFYIFIFSITTGQLQPTQYNLRSLNFHQESL